ncbi:MAG: hypothetical protein WA705_22275 [Candidatus Ozemobacteraceae bacterium]
MKNKHIFIKGFCGAALVFLSLAVSVSGAGLMDKAISFYTSAMPNPPQIPIEVGKVVALANTGDIIIENNRAFPQWAALIATLVPGTRYVHAGMVVRGHVLKQINAEFGRMNGSKQGFTVYRKQRSEEIREGKTIAVWRWTAQSQIHYGRAYVITPDVVEKEAMSRVVALDLGDYLCDPGVGYPTKHIKLIRAPIANQSALNRLVKYLGYHLLKGTPYDMGFSITENEQAVRRTADGNIEFDLSIMPVPLYCTELLLRALKEADVTVGTTLLNRKAAAVAKAFPKLPAMVAEKLDAPFITADCFIPRMLVLYENQPAPAIGELMGSITHSGFRLLCQNLKDRFQAVAGFTKGAEETR